MKETRELLIVPLSNEVKEYFEKKIVNNKQHSGDSGIDLITNEEVIIQPFETKLVGLGIKAAMYKVNDGNDINVSWQLYPRSSISKTPLMLHNSIGLIDRDYRGEIKAPLRNMSNKEYKVEKGVRLVQAVAGNVEHEIVFELVTQLEETIRGEGGFGSTGKK
jgi:dUTP pyrophosphatase